MLLILRGVEFMVITINDLIQKAQKERLFKKDVRKFSFEVAKKQVEVEISPYTICNYGSITYYVRLLKGFLTNHQLITLCDNHCADIDNFHHYGGRIEQLDGFLAVTVYID